MRFILTLLFCCAAPLVAADLSVVRIWPAYRTAASFERMSEFFTGQENTGGQTILRSRPDDRAGFYFLTRLKNSGPALAGARVELSLIKPTSPEPKVYASFAPTDVPAGSHVFQIGLTGDDWADPGLRPVAWQLRLLAADGTELVREESFLWGKETAAK